MAKLPPLNFPHDCYPHPPKRNDEIQAKRWRGALFWQWHFKSPIAWTIKGQCVPERLKPPHSVTFPICGICGHVIWDWPHFEEPVPEKACCTACGEEELRASDRDQ